MEASHKLPPDRMNAVGVLNRREIEARLVAPLIDALAEEFGREQVLEVVRRTVLQIARQQGEQLARSLSGNGIAELAASLEAWKKDGAMQMEVLEQDEQVFSFNAVRCRYAEMYHDLGIPELGALLSCNRDRALIEGFNSEIELTRTQTIMEGASFCDFGYRLK